MSGFKYCYLKNIFLKDLQHSLMSFGIHIYIESEVKVIQDPYVFSGFGKKGLNLHV